jgi:radical SAM/Cys-rich protein
MSSAPALTPPALSAPNLSAPNLSAPNFSAHITHATGAPLLRATPTTLQVNLGKRCNMACLHCHVEAGPKRTEEMSEEVATQVVELLTRCPTLTTLDLTGGAPELNPHFRGLVRAARALGRRVIDRCNLTILLEPGQEDLADVLAAQGVEVVASLPCYLEDNVERQRGKGAFGKSLEALHRLNALGYGREGSPLTLNLVYNPIGPALPPAQAGLEAAYKRELRGRYGVEFTRLFTLTNMPIKRFADQLARLNKHDEYMALLVSAFNPGTVGGLMCRDHLSVGWDGRLFDCDFNQMLELPLGASPQPRTLQDLLSAPADPLSALTGAPITTAPHCFGCTAGAGSSCGGALS